MSDLMSTTALDSSAHMELLESLLRLSVDLSAVSDRQKMLEMILTEARRISGAQAGTLYIRRGENLEFVVTQNDVIDVSTLSQTLFGKTLEVGGDSLAGFVASTGRTTNIPDAHHIASGSPFRISRDCDVATGYSTRSILAIPLKCPDDEIVGVLQLINRIDPGGAITPFPEPRNRPIMSLASMAAVSVQNALLTDRLKQAHLDTVIRLSVVAEFRDRNTAKHIERISRLSVLIAQALGLDNKQVELIQYASPMHDIGKIGVPDSILLKPGSLTDEERKIVETHTIMGGEILGNSLNELISLARDIAVSHHERWDGTGYPYRLKGGRIPLHGRIVCLADVFDALASERCYKDAYPVEKVLDIIRDEEGKHFDPKITGAFFDILDEVFATYEED
ncbi:MAG: HD domain-containing protein [Planctomycetota bacterium]|nr:HD domain-containing protein [Planctomycetota bacterium]